MIIFYILFVTISMLYMCDKSTDIDGFGQGFSNLPLIDRMQAHIHAFHEMKMKGQKSMSVDMRRLDDVMEWFIATKELYIKSNNIERHGQHI